MRRILLISLSLVLALAGWSTVGAEDGLYVIPAMRGNYAPGPKTGLTTSYGTRDDGALKQGVAWPTPRLTDNGNGTVTDNLTGLIWMKNANAFGRRTWNVAMALANAMESGYGGLEDGSKVGDWRLPNARELQSLISYGSINPALPTGHPFTGVALFYYWSSTTCKDVTTAAWTVSLDDGELGGGTKADTYLMWCVRGGP